MLHWRVTVICLSNGILLSLARDSPKQRVDDYNRTVLNLPAMGVCIFGPKRPKERCKRGSIYAA
jgi:hypothetical protein